MEKTRKAEITVFYTGQGGENAEGKPYIKLLPYIKLRFFNPVTRTWDNAGEAYLPHNLLELETLRGNYDQAFRVVLEQVEDGAFPSNANRGNAVKPTDNLEIHQYGIL